MNRLDHLDFITNSASHTPSMGRSKRMKTTASVLFSFATMLLAGSVLQAQSPIYFEDAVAPILRKNCIACHNATLAESGLNLETPAKIRQGGDAGSTMDMQNVPASLLLTRASGMVEPIMPPADNTVGANRLTAEELEIIRAWIAAGAQSKGESGMVAHVELRLPETARASFAVSASADGDIIASGRGGSLVIHDAKKLSAAAPATATVDPLPLQVIANAHPDYIHSIATSFDGQYIATGSTGQVKIWKKESPSFDAVRKALEASAGIPSEPAADATLSSVQLNETLSLSVVNRALQIQEKKSPELTEPVANHPLVAAVTGGGPIDMIALSPDKTKLATATWDDTKSFVAIKLWSIPESKLIGPFERSRSEQFEYTASNRLALRQQVTIDRIAKSVDELDKASQAETNAVNQSREARDKVSKSMTDKEAEKATAMQAVADHEKMMADTKAAIEAATKQLEALTAELETKKKKVTELESQSLEIKKQVDVANQTLMGTEQSQQAAAMRLETAKQLSAKRAEELIALKAASDALKAKSDSVRFKAEALAFANDRLIVTSFTEPSTSVSSVDLFAVETLDRNATQVIERAASPTTLKIVAAAMGATSWKLDRTIDSPKWIADRVTALAFDPTSTRLAIGSGLPSRSGRLAIVNVADGQLISMPVPPGTAPGTPDVDLHSDTILGLAYSPDGKWLASCGADKMTKLIDVASNTVVKVLEGHTHHVLSIAWHEDGYRLATASADATVKVWDAERGEAIQTISGFGTEVTALAFAGGTTQVFSSSINNIARLHDVNNGQLIRQYGPAADSLYSVAVAPTGKFAMAVGQEGVLRVWAVDDGRLVAELK